MDNLMNQLLDKFGLSYDELQPNEKVWLNNKVAGLKEGQLTVEKIREYVKAMRSQAEVELAGKKEAPVNFITLLTFFIPVIGLMRKWYQDQHEVEIKARIRVLVSIEHLLTTPERRRKEIEQALANLSEPKDDFDDEGEG